MLTLHGIQHKSGTYEGRPYDNVMLHCLDDAPFTSPSSQLVGGRVCEILKIPLPSFSTIFGGVVASLPDLVAMIGEGLTVAYDRYGRPSSITFIDSKGKGV